jgi:hypothetical protein
MVVRLVAAVVARGGILAAEGERLVCRLPRDDRLPQELAAAIRTYKPAIVAALAVAPLAQTVRHVLALSEEERDAYRAALAHDLAALAAAEAELVERSAEAAP